MLVGMAAGGWLIVRSTLVWGDNNGDDAFGIDIPIAAAVLALWAGAATLLLRPPRSVLAWQSGPFRTEPLLVWC